MKYANSIINSHTILTTSLLWFFFATLNVQAVSLNLDKNKTTPMILVPIGEFEMGSNLTDPLDQWKRYGSREPWYLNEHPLHTVMLNDFYVDKFEVTNKNYIDYLQGTGQALPKFMLKNGYALRLKKEKIALLDNTSLQSIIADIMKLDINALQLNKEQLLSTIISRWTYQDSLPVTHISWFDADKYCKFKNKRLLTEQEWAKAAKGPEGNRYIFGNKWLMGKSNVGEEYWEDGVAPIGSYPLDKSYYGIMDMAGNAYEWVNDWYQAYPNSDYDGAYFGTKFKTVRGSGYGKNGHYFLLYYQRTAYRSGLYPDVKQAGQGFRCAKDTP